MTITRWEFSKSRSNYHFDPRVNEDAAPPFRIVGRVYADLASELARMIELYGAKPNGFKNRLSVQTASQEKPFTEDMDLAELAYLGLDPDHKFFLNVRARSSELVQKIGHHFKFEHWTAGFHIQRPGDLFPYHVDELPGIKENQIDHWLDRDPKWAARFEIQIYDWTPGHVWSYGNTYWKQWQAGDIAWHDWRNTPHGTANISRVDRATLQFTGLCSQATLDIIAAGNLEIRV